VWTPQGLIFHPDDRIGWQRSHASLPTILDRGEHWRVFFASRDDRQRSHVGFFDLDPATGTVLGSAAQPVLSPAGVGLFDQDGVYPASIVETDGRVLMYYIGWTAGEPPPMFYAAVGLAVSDDGGDTFTRVSPAPVLDRSEHDPWMVTGPCVLKDRGRWRMWYVSGLGWDGPARSRYHVKHAESEDGVRWHRDGTVAIDLEGRETNISRPCVTPAGDGYRAWFAADRGGGYTVTAADSSDGLSFTRNPGAAAGLGSHVSCYPAVRGGVMLYNGQNFGRDGVQLARAANAAAVTGV